MCNIYIFACYCDSTTVHMENKKFSFNPRTLSLSESMDGQWRAPRQDVQDEC